MPAPALLKRKRTDSEDEENIRPAQRQRLDSENQALVDGLLSPESEPSRTTESSEQDSELGSLSDNVPFRDSYCNLSWSQVRALSCPLTPAADYMSPLPLLSWADPQEVWELMCCKNEQSMSQRDETMFSKHPQLQPRMRSILLDWLIEVSEVYKLHRETYHLAVDFIDRYLSGRRDVPKGQLQLIGITCLFIAAKTEEIYPPKIHEFAYVTDGACIEDEILEKELLILKALNWNLSPVTVNGWLTMYVQLCNENLQRRPVSKDVFVYPQFSGLVFVRTVQLVDLILLDEGSLRYSYSVLAATALWHMGDKALALSVSGLNWEDISDCVKWTHPFALTVKEESVARLNASACEGKCAASENAASSGLLKTVPRIVVDDTHNIQIHTIDLQMLERAQNRQNQQLLATTSLTDSPVTKADIQADPGLLTPPASQKKPCEKHAARAGSSS